jgi:hypothetical protein
MLRSVLRTDAIDMFSRLPAALTPTLSRLRERECYQNYDLTDRPRYFISHDQKTLQNPAHACYAAHPDECLRFFIHATPFFVSRICNFVDLWFSRFWLLLAPL